MDGELFSYLHTPIHVDIRYQTVPDRLRTLADELGEKEVFVFLGHGGSRESVTARDLYLKSTQLAKSLIKLGVKKGDIVGLCMSNDINCLLSYLGVICAGGIASLLTMDKKDGSDATKKIDELKIETLFLHPREQNEQFLICLKFIDDIGPDGSAKSKALPCLKRFISTSRVDGYHLMTIDKLLKPSNDAADIPLPRLDPDDTMVMFATSGSTGMPKFVPFTHRSAMIAGYHLQEGIQFSPGSVCYTERKLAWIGGFPFSYIHSGIKSVMKSVTFSSLEEHCKFTLRAIRDEKCTMASLFVATIVEAIRSPELKENTFPLLENINTGSMPVTPATMSAIGVLAHKVINLYGGTETGVLTGETITRAADFVPFSTGKPLPGVEVKVVGKDGHVVKRGEVGSVHARSPVVLYQYYNNPEQTRAVISDTHWFNTNDVGYVTPEGHLVVMGREKEQIIQGGAILYPALVEAVVKTHPAVLEVVIVPVPDQHLFQKICACVVLKPGHSKLTLDDIMKVYGATQYTNRHEPFVSLYPKEVIIFDELPKLFSGKPNKVRIIEHVLKQLGIE